MKVYVLGAGCTWFKRKNTCFLLDETMLFDVSEGAYKDIIDVVDIFKLKTVFISHFHADHFFDLHILATRIMREGKERGMTEKLKVFGPKGTLDQLIKTNKLIFGGPDECSKKELQKNIEFIDVGDGDEFKVNGYKVNVYKLDHGAVYSQGYTFTDKNGKVIAFTADTKDCKRLREMLSVADVAFVDMATVERINSHLNTSGFVELSKIYKKCKMFPVHTSDASQEFAIKHKLNVVNDGDTFIF